MILKSSGEPNLPTHLDLPDRDGSIVENSLESPQRTLLTQAMRPWLIEHIHPDERFFIGTDVGIYWKIAEPEPLRGCKAPDWYYVPGVPHLLDGEARRSYVFWQEKVPPLIFIEFLSKLSDGSEERDATPESGKFWVYEQVLKGKYYFIYDAFRDLKIDVYHRVRGRFRPMKPNERGHYPVPEMQAELGLWSGTHEGYTLDCWLRWFDLDGKLIPSPAEREKERADKLAAKLRAMGVDPDRI